MAEGRAAATADGAGVAAALAVAGRSIGPAAATAGRGATAPATPCVSATGFAGLAAAGVIGVAAGAAAATGGAVPVFTDWLSSASLGCTPSAPVLMARR